MEKIVNTADCEGLQEDLSKQHKYAVKSHLIKSQLNMQFNTLRDAHWGTQSQYTLVCSRLTEEPRKRPWCCGGQLNHHPDSLCGN